MVSNHNTSRPPHWPPGALRASVGEVPTQPQTASVEALPELSPWEAQAIWLPVGPQNHFFPSGHPRSACAKYPRPDEVILRMRKASGRIFASAVGPSLKPGKVMNRGNSKLSQCAACGSVEARVGAKTANRPSTASLPAQWQDLTSTSFSHYFELGSIVSSCGNWNRPNVPTGPGNRKVCGNCIVEHQAGEE